MNLVDLNYTQTVYCYVRRYFRNCMKSGPGRLIIIVVPLGQICCRSLSLRLDHSS